MSTMGILYCMVAFHEWMTDTMCWAFASPCVHSPNGTVELHAFRRSRLFWKNADMDSDTEYSMVTNSAEWSAPHVMAIMSPTVLSRRMAIERRFSTKLSTPGKSYSGRLFGNTREVNDVYIYTYIRGDGREYECDGGPCALPHYRNVFSYTLHVLHASLR